MTSPQPETPPISEPDSSADATAKPADAASLGLVILRDVAILAGALANIVTLNVAGVLMSVFTILFGAVLCCFELRTASSDRITRTYCGFMYSFWGRLLFLLLYVNRG